MSSKSEFWSWVGPLSVCVAFGMIFGRLDYTLAEGGPFLVAVSNVASFWLTLAFLVGLIPRFPSHAALCGVVALFAALFSFYDAWHLPAGSVSSQPFT